jgi:hypothetical protein
MTEAPFEATLLHRLCTGPPEAGVGVVVTTTRTGIVRLRELAKRLEGVTTLHAVLPPRPMDVTTDDADDFAELMARLLAGTVVHTIAGHSVASYLGARLAVAREKEQDRPPKVVLLEPPLPSTLISKPLLLPELVQRRFIESLPGGTLATSPPGTPEFRGEVVHTFRTHRAELEAALHSVDPAELLAAPALAVDLYTEWAGWKSLCMQLATVTYAGPTVCVEGLFTAELDEDARGARFAEIRRTFPTVRFEETTSLHSDLTSAALLLPHFQAPS